MWAVCLAGLLPGTASATFRGRDGLIAYENAPDRVGDIDEIDALIPGKAPLVLVSCPTAGTIARHYSDPSFAPDGKAFVFSTFERCAGAHPSVASTITIARTDGRVVRDLPRLTSHDRSPQFLPSGKQLVFAGRARSGGQYDLYTVGIGGARLRRLTTDGGDDPAPCANGTIAFVHRGGIYLLSSDHRTRRLVLPDRGSSPLTSGLSCSPDSRRIAFVRSASPFTPGALYVVGISDGRARRVTVGRVVVGTPAFSPSGRLVAVSETHRNTLQWPRPKRCPPGQPYTHDLVIVNLHGKRADPPVDISCNGTPGGISWQSLRDQSTATPLWRTRAQIDPHGLLALTCPAASLCVATDTIGQILTSANPARGTSPWRTDSVDPSHWLQGVSCPSPKLCVAVDNAGNVVTSADPAAGASAWTIAHVDGTNSLSSVSCPSASLCVAVDNAGNVITSTNPLGGAAAWSVNYIDNGITYECYHYGRSGPECQPAFTAVSCPTTSLCLAEDDSGNGLSSRDPAGGASSWSKPSAGATASDWATGISCRSPSLCVTSVYAGYVSTWNPLNPSNGTIADLDEGSLGGIACPLPFLCFAYAGRLFGSADPVGGVSAWQVLDTVRADITGVACPSVTPCIAVDTRGELLAGPPPATIGDGTGRG